MAIDGCSAPGTCLNWPDCFCEIPLSTWRLCGKESMLISLQCKERPFDDLVCNGRLTCWWSFRLGWFHRFGRALVLLYLLERQRRTRWGRRMQWGISFLILFFFSFGCTRNDIKKRSDDNCRHSLTIYTKWNASVRKLFAYPHEKWPFAFSMRHIAITRLKRAIFDAVNWFVYFVVWMWTAELWESKAFRHRDIRHGEKRQQ